MLYQAFFFDFDGVLADSVEVKTRAFAKLFESYGPGIQDVVVGHHRRNGGMTRRDKFKHYYNVFLQKPLDEVGLERLCGQFSSLVVDEVVAAPEIPGSKDFLEKWYSSVDCFVVSATPDDEISVVVERRDLKCYFREVLGSSRSKEENVRVLMEKYGLVTSRCLFFGDAESDYKAAKVCNMDFLGILPGPDAPLLKVAPEIRWVRDFVGMDLRKLIGRR